MTAGITASQRVSSGRRFLEPARIVREGNQLSHFVIKNLLDALKESIVGYHEFPAHLVSMTGRMITLSLPPRSVSAFL